ncbi:MAG: CDGSH iron-sulfur domain-containing protein [Dehalococcoidia bacterium]
MSKPIEIAPQNNGPHRVTGAVEVQTPNGVLLIDPDPAFLCRCGQSVKKPLIDATHTRIGFSAAEAVEALGQAAVDGFVAVAEEVAVGEGDVAEVNGRTVAVAPFAGMLSAIPATCTSAEANLSDGGLAGKILVCPVHDRGFNSRTGQSILPSVIESAGFNDGRIEGDVVFVSVGQRAES